MSGEWTVEDIVDFMDTIMNILAFSVMFTMTAWTLIKYRK